MQLVSEERMVASQRLQRRRDEAVQIVSVVVIRTVPATWSGCALAASRAASSALSTRSACSASDCARSLATVARARALEKRLAERALDPLQRSKDRRGVDLQSLRCRGERSRTRHRQHHLELRGTDLRLRGCNS
jgi:hypothetical protein